MGRAAALRAATRSGALGVAGENRTELGARTGGGIGSSGGHDGDGSQNSGVLAGAVLSVWPLRPAPPAAMPLRFGLLVILASAAGRPGRSGREGSGCRAGGTEWHGCRCLGSGLDRPALLRGRHEAGRFAAGIHGTKWRDADGNDRYGSGVGGGSDFRAGCGGPGPTRTRGGSLAMIFPLCAGAEARCFQPPGFSVGVADRPEAASAIAPPDPAQSARVSPLSGYVGRQLREDRHRYRPKPLAGSVSAPRGASRAVLRRGLARIFSDKVSIVALPPSTQTAAPGHFAFGAFLATDSTATPALVMV